MRARSHTFVWVGPIAALLAAGFCATAMAVDPPEDIRDIRGPKFVHPAWLYPALLSAGVLLAFSAYGVWRWRRRAQTPRTLLPFEVALRRLEEIRPLMFSSTAREFGIAVSDIVRSYIEQKFNITATQRTTEEFLQDLLKSSNASLDRHRLLLSEFLHQCDLVKFAGVSPAPQILEALRHCACGFVRETAGSDAEPEAGKVPS
jgi:hypothetical protein